ncbi:tetraacyldisaccharide 4'-kinase [Halosquirtibacter xylanolyticus]|uniref:tetraacyldisaccharide 4'-kinase n=1 Tax=Halosquirtibacter xylanolyticus TaxID=3374599 RepID=UPI003747FB99|nr:tetraacyldisaccharide 4'-kinase [Prolixibacteraceae bacterium]
MGNIFLKPLSWIYGFITYIRNLMYDYKIFSSKEYAQPIISIGNITVGGTGKTPHTEYLIELLKSKFKIATLSRGYKRKTTGFLEVKESSTAQEVGDEPLQMKMKNNDIVVAVDEKRVRGIDNLLAYETSTRPEVILLDDAFQHRKVNPGLHILLTDFNRLITQDHILPYGRLRESAEERYRAQIIIVTKCPEILKPIEERLIIKELDIKPFQDLFFTTLSYGELEPQLNNSSPKITDFSGKNIVLFTGIANPESLESYLTKNGANLKTIIYSDHYQFKKNDLVKVSDEWESFHDEEAILLTTEKDMMRIKDMTEVPDIIDNKLFTIPLKVKFIGENKNYFDKKIVKYVSENASNFNISTKQYRALH